MPSVLRRVRVLSRSQKPSHLALLEDPAVNGSPCVSGLLGILTSNLICNFCVIFLICGANRVEANVQQEGLRLDNSKNSRNRGHPGGGVNVIKVSSGSETVYLYLDLKGFK